MSTRVILGIMGAVGSLGLGGCVAVENDALPVGVLVDPGPAEMDVDLPRDEPSVLALDRANWGATAYVVPRRRVAHWPHYRPARAHLTCTARQRGDAPTLESAYMLDNGCGCALAWQGVKAPFLAFVDAALILPRMVTAPPWTVQKSPVEAYEVLPERRWPTNRDEL